MSNKFTWTIRYYSDTGKSLSVQVKNINPVIPVIGHEMWIKCPETGGLSGKVNRVEIVMDYHSNEHYLYVWVS